MADEIQAKQRSNPAIDRAGKADQPGRHAKRRQRQRIDQDLLAGFTCAGGHGQHGHASLGVILMRPKRQRPEMRRRPDEDDGKKNDRHQRDVARHRGPADQRRKGARGTADDDVLGRAALQPHRVNHHIKQDGKGKHCGGQIIGSESHHHDRTDAKQNAKGKRGIRGDTPGGDGPARGAAHHRINIPIIPHIDGARGTGGHRNAKNGDHCQHWMQMPRCYQQPRDGAEHHQRHDARLQQRDPIAHF